MATRTIVQLHMWDMWTPIPGTALEARATGACRILVTEQGAVSVCASEAFLPRYNTVEIRVKQ